ncbi:MAG TPA: diguanylate cyclase, partial [Spirochaetales bacterium]|nr:diguanylate cyclase [Spirochaetales bacterium]
DAATAKLIAERIRRSVEGMGFDYEGQKIAVTLSLGIAQYDQNRDLTGKSVIDRADKALYASKQAGKNRVSVSP